MFKFNQRSKKGKKNKKDDELIKNKIASLGQTFCSKLIIKLVPKFLIPDLYLYILKYEYANRSSDDIKKIIPRFNELIPLKEYLYYYENNDYDNIIKEISKLSFYKSQKKLSIIKKANEDKNKFFILLNGSIYKLSLIFIKEKISLEDYIIYMIKMKLLEENQIFLKCNKLNKNYIDIHDIKHFKEYNYKELLSKAKNNLIYNGFTINNNNDITINSIDNYLRLNELRINGKNENQAKFYLYIGKYIKEKILNKGEFIGDLSLNENNEGNTYICEQKCDIAFINKTETNKSLMYKYILDKYKKIFLQNFHKFYIFKDLLNNNNSFFENNFFPYIIYKKYKKGENIILQNSQYEGVYFIIDGRVQISLFQTFNELSNTLISLQYSIYNFRDYASKITKTVDILNDFHLNFMINSDNIDKKNESEKKSNNKIFSSNEYMEYFKGYKNIELFTCNRGDVLGLNELFDYKTELYNFQLKCISDETNVFFMSKEYFQNIMEKEGSIMNNVIKLIDLRAKALIGRINSFRINYKNGVFFHMRNKKKIFYRNQTKSINDSINIDNSNSNLNSINESSKERSYYSLFPQTKIKISKKKYKLKNIDSIKLFKNNELLNYLKNKKLLKINALNIQNILNNKYKTGNVTPNNISIKNNNSFMINSENNGRNKDNKLKQSFSQINWFHKNDNKIIFKKSIIPIENEENLLLNVNRNQKEFDKREKDYYLNSYINNNEFPLLKKNKKISFFNSYYNNNSKDIKKRFIKNKSFKNMRVSNKLKIFE